MEKKKRFVFSSSKMSGMPGHNIIGFNRKRLELKRRFGWQVWDQFTHICTSSWSREIGKDLDVLEENCWAIYMWGKWYCAQGAWVELISAHRMGLKIYIEQWWLRWIKWMLNLLFGYKRK